LCTTLKGEVNEELLAFVRAPVETRSRATGAVREGR
jgi:hypothetical protein